MSLKLLEEYRNKLEHHFDLMSFYMPHLFIKDGLRELPKSDLDALLEDLKIFLATKLKDMHPHDGDSFFGIPFVSYYLQEVPTIAPKYESEDGVRVSDFGLALARSLFEMIFQHFSNGDTVYFTKYHGVICIRRCKTALECNEVRKLVMERDRLKDELEQVNFLQAPPPIPEVLLEDNELQIEEDEEISAEEVHDSSTEEATDEDAGSESDEDIPLPAKRFKSIGE